MERFVSRGMIADFAVHQPDKEGGIRNPHFHVLCPIRPLKENGEWDVKQHRAYVLDERGNRIRGGDGKIVVQAREDAASFVAGGVGQPVQFQVCGKGP